MGSFALLSRGWIVPVGGATPDRLKDDRLGSIRESIEGLVVRGAFLDLELGRGFRGGGSFRSGVQPPTGSRWIVHKVGDAIPDRLMDAIPDRHEALGNGVGGGFFLGGV